MDDYTTNDETLWNTTFRIRIAEGKTSAVAAEEACAAVRLRQEARAQAWTSVVVLVDVAPGKPHL